MEATSPTNETRERLLDELTDRQAAAVAATARRLLVVAGAGSGKTEVMARRIAWWIGVEGVPRDRIVAFTFTEKAAEEMQFRIRSHIDSLTGPDEDATLGGMYIGTIHGFCLQQLRELDPDTYHAFDVIDDAARLALVQRGFWGVLGLQGLQQALSLGQYATADRFLETYDLLNEYDELEVQLSEDPMPYSVSAETDWCKEAKLLTDVGDTETASAFAISAARYYAFSRCRRFLDFSTSQSELMRLLRGRSDLADLLREKFTHVVIDEVQDINPIQDALARELVGESGSLTAVGDHRQAIFAWRGGRVDIMGRLFEELEGEPGGDVVELTHNFRSTGRIIDLANRWSETIGPVATMGSPDMEQGNPRRNDESPKHVAVLNFAERSDEAGWISTRIEKLVPGDGRGAAHDGREGERGLAYGDVAVLLRSSTDARTYMTALQARGIPTVFRAGPDLFSQPEVLLFVAALGLAAGLDQFAGNPERPNSLPGRIASALDSAPEPVPVIHAAAGALRAEGLTLADDVEERLEAAGELLAQRIAGEKLPAGRIARLQTGALRELLGPGSAPRRVFPQRLFHLLMAEAGARNWDVSGRGASAMFHLGALSTLISGIETPGWTSASDFRWQMIALCLWGTQNARTEEAPLLVEPDAVTISTIHAAKGLEFGAVFLADVRSRRFPSNFARSVPQLAIDGQILTPDRPHAAGGHHELRQRTPVDVCGPHPRGAVPIHHLLRKPAISLLQRARRPRRSIWRRSTSTPTRHPRQGPHPPFRIPARRPFGDFVL